MKRSKKHVVVGISFVLASILVAVAIYVGIKIGAGASPTPIANASDNFTSESENAVDEREDVSDAAEDTGSDEAMPSTSAVSAEELIGTFGDKAGSDCTKQNWEFMADGSFALMLDADKSPITGQWELVDGALHLSNMSMPGDDEQGEETLPVARQGNGIRVGKMLLYPCNAD